MKGVYFFLLIFILSSPILAQDLHFEWAKSVRGINADQGNSIISDASGNTYITGYYSGQADFDPGPQTYNLNPLGSKDIFIQKLNRNGQFIWAKSIGSTGIDEGKSIAMDASGNVYISGFFSGTVDFDPDTSTHYLSSNGLKDAFLLKLDKNGNFIWVKSIGGTSDDYGTSVTADAFGNIYNLGYYYGTVDFNPTSATFNITSNGFWDVFVQKFDTAGNFIWAKSIGGTSDDHGQYITTSSSGNVFITGRFKGTADFDPDTSSYNILSNGLFDAFVTKLDPNGSLVWAHSMGSVLDDYGNCISIDASDNVYTIGNYRGTVDFDPGSAVFNLTSTNGLFNGFIQKLDNNGNFMDAQAIGNAITFANSILIDALENKYITGEYYGIVDFDPDTSTYSLSSAGNADIFLLKLDSADSYVWAKSMGGTNADIGLSLGSSSTDNIYVTGYFNSFNADFDPDTSTYIKSKYHLEDVFVLKLSECGLIAGTDQITSCADVTWIDGKTYTESDSTATHIIALPRGCDSVVTLDLTIEPVFSTDLIYACNSYKWIDSVRYYYDNNIATYTYNLPNGCDSIVKIDLNLTKVDVGMKKVSSTTYSAQAATAGYQWLDCDNKMAPIPGATTRMFTPTSYGSYAVEVTQNNCTDTSICLSNVYVGLEKALFEEVSVHPNPSNGKVYLNVGELGPVSMQVYNSLGKLVYREEKIAANSSYEINLQVDPGLYFVEISHQGYKKRYRLVVR